MARFGDEPDIELVGRLAHNGSQKAYAFIPDFGDDEIVWVPRSQAEWVPDTDRDDKGGTMLVKAWLARKNGWDRA